MRHALSFALVAALLAVGGSAAAQDAARPAEVAAPPSAESSPPVDAPPAEAATPSVASEAPPTPAEAAESVAAPAAPTAEDAARAEAEAEADRRYAHDLRLRNDLATAHRILGISTWFAMASTLVLGFMQFHDLYNFQGQNDNPCTTGNGVILPEYCFGTAWPHRIAAFGTASLYLSTFTLSLFMPDPDHADQGSSEAAERMRQHKVLRWVHFGGMVAQFVLGLLVGNNVFGNRANDYDTQQALMVTHLSIGVLTFGALSWAGALMTF